MISIRNWERFQHYKDRNPPWIKLYRSILNNPEWAKLSDASARLLVELWLLASEFEQGDILLPLSDLQWRLRKQDASVMLASLQELASQGFIDSDEDTITTVCQQRASNVLDQRQRQRQRHKQKGESFEKEFSTFWEQYPLKVGKKAALKAYQARRREGISHEEIMDGLKRYLDYKAAVRQRHHNPATFLGPNEWYREPWTVTESETVMEGKPKQEDGPAPAYWRKYDEAAEPKGGNGPTRVGEIQLNMGGQS